MKGEPKTILVMKAMTVGTKQPLIHWLKRNKQLACGATIKRIWKPTLGYLRGFLRGQYQPICPACRAAAKKRK